MDVYVVLFASDFDPEGVLAVEPTLEAAKKVGEDSGVEYLALEQWTVGGHAPLRWVKRGVRGDWVEDALR